MKISGDVTLNAPADRVWAALNDPEVLVRTIPGCRELELVGEDAYKMTIMAGVASIKGLYSGDVSMLDKCPPDSYRLKASGAGAPGTVSADVRVMLVAEADGTTRLTYDADAVVGGMVGGVGQRMLTSVAKKTAREFFNAVSEVLEGTAPAAAAPIEPGEQAASEAQAKVFTAPEMPSATAHGTEFLKGAALGALAVLLGVIVGGVIARRP